MKSLKKLWGKGGANIGKIVENTLTDRPLTEGQKETLRDFRQDVAFAVGIDETEKAIRDANERETEAKKREEIANAQIEKLRAEARVLEAQIKEREAKIKEDEEARKVLELKLKMQALEKQDNIIKSKSDSAPAKILMKMLLLLLESQINSSMLILPQVNIYSKKCQALLTKF